MQKLKYLRWIRYGFRRWKSKLNNNFQVTDNYDGIYTSIDWKICFDTFEHFGYFAISFQLKRGDQKNIKKIDKNGFYIKMVVIGTLYIRRIVLIRSILFKQRNYHKQQQVIHNLQAQPHHHKHNKNSQIAQKSIQSLLNHYRNMKTFGQLKDLLESNQVNQKNPNQSAEMFEKFKANFQIGIKEKTLKNTDIDLLLRKTVEYKIKGFKDYYDLLKSNGADINFIDTREKKSNLIIACQNSSYEIVKVLCEDQKVNVKLEDNQKKNALYYAIEAKGNDNPEKCVKAILDRQPGLINNDTGNPKSILIAAIQKGKPEIIKVLLERGASIHQPLSDTGNTPLHQAVKMWKSKKSKVNQGIVQLLLERGANVDCKNKQGKTALDMAQKLKDQLIKICIDTKVVNNQGRVDQIQQTMSESNRGTFQLLSQDQQESKTEIFTVNQSSVKASINSQNVLREKQENQARKSTSKPLIVLNNSSQVQEMRAQAHEQFQNQKHRLDVSQIKQIHEDDYQSCHEQQESEGEIETNSEAYETFEPANAFISQLDEQIVDFMKQCRNQHEIADQEIKGFLQEFKRLTKDLRIQVQIYGTFATGLWLKHCDIDLLIIPHREDKRRGDQILEDLYGILRKWDALNTNNSSQQKNQFKINLNMVSKVPMIRMQVPIGNLQNINDKLGYFSKSVVSQSNFLNYFNTRARKIDITVIDKSHNGQETVQYINQYLKMIPQMQAIYAIIKSLTYQYKLYDPKNGGIRSYAIFLMLLSFLQAHVEKSTAMRLLEFLYYFGYIYDYDGQYQHQNPTMARQKSINIMDPLNQKNNVGKGVDVLSLQRMFKTAYIALHLKSRQAQNKKLEVLFETKKMYFFYDGK